MLSPWTQVPPKEFLCWLFLYGPCNSEAPRKQRAALVRERARGCELRLLRQCCLHTLFESDVRPPEPQSATLEFLPGSYKLNPYLQRKNVIEVRRVQ